MTASHEHKGAAYAIISGLLYGLLGYFGMSIINAHFSISNMLFWRFLVSSVVVGIILIPKYHQIKEDRKEIFKVLIYDSAFYSASSIIYFLASRYIGTGLSMVIFFTYPAVVVLLNWIFYRTGVTSVYYIAITIITLGLFLLINKDDFGFDIVGIALSLLGAIMYAAYVVSSKKKRLSPLISTFALSIGCTVACFICALIENSLAFPQTLILWGHISAVGILCTALPILFLLESLSYISSEKTSILSVLEPVFVVIFGIVLLNEKVSFHQILGIVVVLLGALITLFSHTLENHPLIRKWVNFVRRRPS